MSHLRPQGAQIFRGVNNADSKSPCDFARFNCKYVFLFRAQAQLARSNEAGAVFVMNNSATRNQIISFTRAADGSLQRAGTFATGGRYLVVSPIHWSLRAHLH